MATRLSGVVGRMPSLIRIRVSILSGANSMLTPVDRDAGVPGIHGDFSSKGRSTWLNGVFLNSGVRGMPIRKDHIAVDIVFSIIGFYTYRVTEFQKDAKNEWSSSHVF